MTKKLEKEREAANAEMARKQREASTEYYNHQSARPGSLASKANMVKAFDEKNNKKNNEYKK